MTTTKTGYLNRIVRHCATNGGVSFKAQGEARSRTFRDADKAIDAFAAEYTGQEMIYISHMAGRKIAATVGAEAMGDECWSLQGDEALIALVGV